MEKNTLLNLEHYTIHARILANFEKYVSQAAQKYPAPTDRKDPGEYDNGAVENRAGRWITQNFMKDDTDPVHSFFKRCATATGLDNVEIIVCMQQPGVATPPHQDYLYSYRKRHNLCNISDNDRYQRIKRYWMPLEDWKTGHCYQSNNKVFLNWKAGDLFTGPEDHCHSAATSGTDARHFAQITGCIPTNGEYLGKHGYKEVVVD
tara:strand:- start:1954 stop:2568 length:615 start_codon:yes stop_codon:yes gene_type:complete